MKDGLKLIVQILDSESVKLTFPSLENASAVIHKGRHINSVDNWKRYLPHGNTKKPVTRFIGESPYLRVNIRITEMLLVDEVKWPSQIKYRLVVDGNFGRFCYCSTSDMRLSKSQFEKLTDGIIPDERKRCRVYKL